MRNGALTALILVTLAMPGCSRKNALELLMPDEGDFAKAYMESVRAGNITFARQYMAPELVRPDIDQNLMRLSEHFPGGELIEVSLVSFKWHENLTEGVFDGDFDFQYHCDDGWAIVHVTLRRTRKDTTVSNIELALIHQSLESTNRFTLKNRDAKAHFFLGLSFAIPVFIFWSAILCFRTPMRRRKWLWLLFILFGFLAVTLNWSTGHLEINLLGLRLLGSSAEKGSPYSPWMITISAPVGAVVFLLQRRRLAARAPGQPASHNSLEPTPAPTACLE